MDYAKEKKTFDLMEVCPVGKILSYGIKILCLGGKRRVLLYLGAIGEEAWGDQKFGDNRRLLSMRDVKNSGWRLNMMKVYLK